MKPATISSILALGILILSSVAIAQSDYSHGHGALQVFDAKGQANSPLWVQVWIGFMLLSFVTGLLFVKNHPIARWVVGGFVLGLIASTALSRSLGIPVLSGYIACSHILFWTPALYQLLSKRPFLGERSAFSIWSGVITFVILFSFVFDIRDAFIYLRHII